MQSTSMLEIDEQRHQMHEDQLVLKAVDKDYSFKFSVRSDNLYIDSLDQSITYGWESVDVTTNAGKAEEKTVTQMAFNAKKTTNDITLNGSIYVNSEIGSGVDNFTKFKNMCNTQTYWYLIAFKKEVKIDQSTKKVISETIKTYQLKGGDEGKWYVKSISQNSSEFITGLNALKIGFTISISKNS